ncbi:DNA polymerase beta domain protein region [Methanofollis liminatans DSM 4140]|uniref:protein adenylyltransferase n=2 Tax=Methanofollis liminatans TaxID=2201 RepID=J1APD6_9EURY|nr:DNA polymerase beta domain protein region [Methanofollis liminatans DSM 4140]
MECMAGTVETIPETWEVQRVLEILRQAKPDLLKKYGVREIGVFGSYSRNEQVEGSDVDILVDLAHPIGWDVVDLRDDLEHLLGLRVDLVLKGGIDRRKNLRRSISRDLV